MKQVLLMISILFIAGCASNNQKPNNSELSRLDINGCSNFLGRWQSETLNAKYDYINTQVAEYLPNGDLRLHFKNLDTKTREIIDEYSTVRKWDCDGILYITKNIQTNDIEPGFTQFKVYEILVLTKNTIKYKTMIGHTPGNVFELIRK